MGVCKESAQNGAFLWVLCVEKRGILFSTVLFLPFWGVYVFSWILSDTLLYHKGFFPTWFVVWKKYYCTIVVNMVSLRLLFLLTECLLMTCFLIIIFSKSRPLWAILLLSIFYKQQFLRSLQKAVWKIGFFQPIFFMLLPQILHYSPSFVANANSSF